MKNYFFLIIFSVVLISGCTEDIELNISGSEDKIVVEGSIENGKPAEVIITRSSSVTKAVDLSKILVLDAKVFVTNGGITDTLKLTIDSSSSIPLVYKGNKIIGIAGQPYYLTIIADGKTYSAVTTIPQPIPLDSVWWEADPPNDTIGYAFSHLTDPVGYGNAYRILAKRATKDRRFLPPFGPTFDDKFIDGKSFDTGPISRGKDPTADNSKDTDEYYFNKRDTIYIKFCTIDNATFRFYLSYETAMQNNGNPFASPTNVKSNINGGGIGIWAGYGVAYDTIMPSP